MKTNSKYGLLLLICSLSLGARAGQQTTEKVKDKTWDGTLSSVNLTDRSINGKSGWFSDSFRIGEDCVISTIGKDSASLSDLHPGEAVNVRYQSLGGVQVATRITEQARSCSGTIQSVDAKSMKLTMEQELFRTIPEHKTVRIASECKVTLNNGDSGSIADLRPGDKITVKYDLRDGKAMAYGVREKTADVVGTLEAIDLPARTVKAEGRFREMPFDLANDCRIIANGSKEAQLKDLELGEKYRFTYEDLNGVSVLYRIAPAEETKPAQTAAIPQGY